MNKLHIPPQAAELEQAVIAACLLERDTFDDVLGVIYTPDCFYAPKHVIIFSAMCEMEAMGSAIDLLTVTDYLRSNGKLDQVGGAYALTELSMSVLSSAHVIKHAKIVVEKYMRRQAIKAANELLAMAYDESNDIFEVLDKAELLIRSISLEITSDAAEPVGNTYFDFLMGLEERKHSKTDIIGIDTGFPDLNQKSRGFQKATLNILAARPSQGKTALALNLSINSRTHCLIYSLETSKVKMVTRMAARICHIEMDKLLTGNITDDEMSNMQKIGSAFNALPIKIDDSTMSLEGIKRSARREKKKNPKLGLIVIDYLQLIEVKGKGNREQEIAKISRDLKILAKELDLSIIALSQLNRSVESTADKRPNLSHLRESGAIEQDADTVMFIWWKEVGKDAQGNTSHECYLIIAKNKDGETGDVHLKFDKVHMHWLDGRDLNQFQSPGILIRNPSEAKNNYNSSDWETDF